MSYPAALSCEGSGLGRSSALNLRLVSSHRHIPSRLCTTDGRITPQFIYSCSFRLHIFVADSMIAFISSDVTSSSPLTTEMTRVSFFCVLHSECHTSLCQILKMDQVEVTNNSRKFLLTDYRQYSWAPEFLQEFRLGKKAIHHFIQRVFWDCRRVWPRWV